MKAYVYLNDDDTYTPFFIEDAVPIVLKDKVSYVDIPDVMNGILKKDSKSGLFYWEIPNKEPEPITPVETIEEKINKLSTITEQNNLITVDAVLGVYEELIALREEVAALKGTSNNA